ncbi:TetR/AcrR family transcriptional regulator [Streptomyces sp. NPDC054796]
MDGAQNVFARDGYTRASIDAISAEAGVSTRTVYNHFRDKRALFQAVIQESARRAAEAQIAVIDRYLSKVTDLEADLVAFCRAFAGPETSACAPHRGLVRQVSAEAGHIPREALEAWREAGPLRVRRELGARLQRLGERGLLRVPDPAGAAFHLMLLTTVADLPDRPEPSVGPDGIVATGTVDAADAGAGPGAGDVAHGVIVAGVRAFLHGYRRRSPGS